MTVPLAIPFWSPAEIEASLPGTVAHLHERRVLAQRELGPVVLVTTTPLELEKALERRRQRACEVRCHRGTGSASARSRRIATRT